MKRLEYVLKYFPNCGIYRQAHWLVVW